MSESPAETVITTPNAQIEEVVQASPFATEGDPGRDPFTLTKPAEAGQLEDEIAEALGVSPDDLMTVIRHTDRDQPISKDNPATLFLAYDGDLDRSKVEKAIDGHTPTAVEADSPAATPEDDKELADLIAKAKSGETLTTKEASRILKHLLGG